MNEYDRGYQEGAEQFREHLSRLAADVATLKSHMDKAAIFMPTDRHPKPFTSLWLVLDGGILTPGHFDGKAYIALSGVEVFPAFWAVIPPHIKSEVGED